MPKNQLEYLRNCVPVMWDGEGVRREDGSQDYVLLCNSKGLVLTTPTLGHLDTATVLDTLITHRGDENQLNVCFGGSYDATMILRSLSDMKKVQHENGSWGPGESVIRTIYYGNKERRKAVPFRLGGYVYTVAYVHRKQLTVTRRGEVKPDGTIKKYKKVETFTLWDIQGCYGGTFVNALKEFKIVKDASAIERMKNARHDFTIENLQEITEYCQEECKWGAQLYRTTLDYAVDLELEPVRHDGGGAYAAALLSKEGVSSHLPPRDETVQDQNIINAVRTAFFGGRIELARIGIMENVREYDIHSAYPAQMVDLPDMLGTWELLTNDAPPSTKRRLYHVKFNFFPDHLFYPLPYRSIMGEVTFPAVGEGWYWDVEYEASVTWAKRYNDDAPEVVEVYEYTPKDENAKPFAFMQERYEQRQRAKAAKQAFQLVLKICMNSGYGKSAQQKGGKSPDYSEGSKLKLPPFFSQEWAGMITAGTRAELTKAACLLSSPEKLVGFATDAIFTLEDIPVKLTDHDLGTWEDKTYEEGVFVQAGVRYTRQGEEWTAKTRGFPARALPTPDRVIEAWKAKETSIFVEVDRFYSFSSAVLGGDLWKKRGQWERVKREIDLTGACPKREDNFRSLKFERGILHVPLEVCKNTVYEDSLEMGLGLISAPYENLEAVMDLNTMRKNIEEADLFGECE